MPACSKHNNLRSKDDEYAAAVIAMNSNSNLASSVFASKWVQVLLRREGILGKRIFSTARKFKFVTQKDKLLIPRETLAISYEIERIARVIESIARGLYFFEKGGKEKWVGGCIVKSPKFLNEDLSQSCYSYELDQIDQAFIYGEKYSKLGLQKKGKYPEVFYYQFFDIGDGNFMLRMTFYNDFVFFVFLNQQAARSSS